MYEIDILNNKINKYRALSIIYLLLKNLIKFLGFSTPLIFLLLFIGVYWWVCLIISIIYVALIRMIWVQFDSKNKVYQIVSEKLKKRKIEYLTNFK